MKLEINDSVKFTHGFIFQKTMECLIGDELKDKSENPFPNTTRIKLSHISQKKKNYEQPDKEGPPSKKKCSIKKDSHCMLPTPLCGIFFY